MAKKLLIGLTTFFVIFTVVFYSQGGMKNLSEHKEVSEVSSQSSSETKTTTTTSNVEPPLPGKKDDWELLVVNEKNRIKDEPTDLTTLSNGKQIDTRIAKNYASLEDAAKEAGYELTVISGYRSVKEQETIYNNDIAEHMSQGLSEEEAIIKAKEYLTEPGLSEHHTGLALDVLDTQWYGQGNMLEEEFGETEAGKWLDENACHHGFVIRYENGKEDITGINYEPWHIRYVGKKNAEYMKENGLVLEEYVDQL